MKRFALLIVMTLLVFGQFLIDAQSRRVSQPTAGKANERKTMPTPTPYPEEVEAETDDSEIVTVDTRLVTIPVRVLDRKNRFVAGLKKESFKVYEDNVEQEVTHFSNEEQPFTVALVLDMSYSTTFKINEIQSAAVAFIDQLRPHDKVMVVSFDQDVHMLCEPTSDRSRIYRAIRSTKISTGTSLYEAVDLVMNSRLRSVEGRKAIILFTDGVDTTSRRTHDLQTLRDAMELDALIYPIRYDTFADVQSMKNKTVILGPTTSPIPTNTGNPFPFPIPTTAGTQGTTVEEYRRAEEYLDQLALRTGGRVHVASTTGNLADAYSKIAGELRQFYSLGYYPKDETGSKQERRVKVRVDQPGLAVRARDSYVAGGKSK